MKKVDEGLTSLEEVLSTCMAESDEEEEQQDAMLEKGLNAETQDAQAKAEDVDKSEIVQNPEVT